MGKSRSKDYSRNNYWNDDNEGYYDHRGDVQKRKEKRVRNLIRSKNVNGLLEIDDDDDKYDWGPDSHEMRGKR